MKIATIVLLIPKNGTGSNGLGNILNLVALLVGYINPNSAEFRTPNTPGIPGSRDPGDRKYHQDSWKSDVSRVARLYNSGIVMSADVRDVMT